MLFTWKYRHGIDGQGRIQFPSKWRYPAGESDLVASILNHKVTKEAYILVLPGHLFESFVARFAALPASEMDVQAQLHDYSERITGVDLDGSRRFTLPVELREAAGLAKDVVLVGCINWFEIWNPERYELAREKGQDRLESMKPEDRVAL